MSEIGLYDIASPPSPPPFGRCVQGPVLGAGSEDSLSTLASEEAI